MEAKLALLISLAALTVATAAYIRREQDLQLTKQLLVISEHISTELDFAKMVEHWDGED